MRLPLLIFLVVVFHASVVLGNGKQSSRYKQAIQSEISIDISGSSHSSSSKSEYPNSVPLHELFDVEDENDFSEALYVFVYSEAILFYSNGPMFCHTRLPRITEEIVIPPPRQV